MNAGGNTNKAKETKVGAFGCLVPSTYVHPVEASALLRRMDNVTNAPC